MTEATPQAKQSWWSTRTSQWAAFRGDREEQVFLVLTLLIGALVGLTVVAFIVLTERFGAHLDPAGIARWRRLIVPTAGSLAMGYLLYRFFPDARGSGVPQTKAALFAHEGQTVGDLLRGPEFPHLHSDQSFEMALDRMDATQLDMLPVVSRANVHELQGTVRLDDLLESYGLKSRSET